MHRTRIRGHMIEEASQSNRPYPDDVTHTSLHKVYSLPTPAHMRKINKLSLSGSVKTKPN